MAIFVASVFIALMVSALCSLLEATVLSLSPGQVDDLARRSPGVGSIWQGFKAQIQKPIAVILILNTAAHTIGATLAGAAFEEQFGTAGLLWFSLLFTYMMLQFTEILPKTMGVRYARQLAPVIARPLAVLVRV
jgi:CBS domain containing-hemolysin-like protein